MEKENAFFSLSGPTVAISWLIGARERRQQIG
jgi:hypothetical protein